MEMTAAVVGPAHGLRGEVTLDVRTDDPTRLTPGQVLSTDSQRFPTLTVETVRPHKGRTLATFEEVLTREDAEALRGATLLVEARDEDDAWYPHQLEGLLALSPTGERLGTVTGLQPGAAQDLLLVDTDRGTVMVPFVHALVPEVDVEGGTITVDAPPGLFDDDSVDAGDRGVR